MRDYCKALKIEPDVVEKTFRDGRKNNFGRIVKVCFGQGRKPDRGAFLRGAKYHMDRDGDFGSLDRKPFVRPDQTHRERLLDRDLREKLKQRRDHGEDVIIRRGAIVPRPPPRSVTDDANGDQEN